MKKLIYLLYFVVPSAFAVSLQVAETYKYTPLINPEFELLENDTLVIKNDYIGTEQRARTLEFVPVSGPISSFQIPDDEQIRYVVGLNSDIILHTSNYAAKSMRVYIFSKMGVLKNKIDFNDTYLGGWFALQDGGFLVEYGEDPSGTNKNELLIYNSDGSLRARIDPMTIDPHFDHFGRFLQLPDGRILFPVRAGNPEKLVAISPGGQLLSIPPISYDDISSLYSLGDGSLLLCTTDTAYFYDIRNFTLQRSMGFKPGTSCSIKKLADGRFLFSTESDGYWVEFSMLDRNHQFLFTFKPNYSEYKMLSMRAEEVDEIWTAKGHLFVGTAAGWSAGFSLFFDEEGMIQIRSSQFFHPIVLNPGKPPETPVIAATSAIYTREADDIVLLDGNGDDIHRLSFLGENFRLLKLRKDGKLIAASSNGGVYVLDVVP